MAILNCYCIKIIEKKIHPDLIDNGNILNTLLATSNTVCWCLSICKLNLSVFPGGSFRPGPPGQPGPPGAPGRDGLGSESVDVGQYIAEYLQSKLCIR